MATRGRKVVEMSEGLQRQALLTRLKNLAAGGSLTTGLAIAALDLDNNDLLHVLRTGRVTMRRRDKGIIMDGICTVCAVEGMALVGRPVRLKIETRQGDAVVVGITFLDV